MLAKHADLATSTLVLVSEAGFSANALAKAEARGVVTMSPTDLDGSDFEGKIVGRLEKIWPRSVALTIESLHITAETPTGSVRRKVPFDVALYREDGTEACNPLSIFERWLDVDFPVAAAMIGLTEITENVDQWFKGGGNPPWNFDGTEVENLYLHDTTTGEVEYHRLLKFEIYGRASIRVGEVALTHKRLGEVELAYGQTTFDGKPTSFVARAGADGEAAAIVFASAVVPLRKSS